MTRYYTPPIKTVVIKTSWGFWSVDGPLRFGRAPEPTLLIDVGITDRFTGGNVKTVSGTLPNGKRVSVELRGCYHVT